MKQASLWGPLAHFWGACAGAGAVAAQDLYRDVDWNVAFEARCGVPVGAGGQPAVFWARVGEDRKLVFALEPGQVGGCAGDASKRHGAEFWERAEVSQGRRFATSRATRVAFEVTFLDGFGGARESFFQIHNWARDCDAYPPLMMKMDRGYLQILALRGASGAGKGRHRSVFGERLAVAGLLGRPQRFEVTFEPRAAGRGWVTVVLGDRVLVERARVDYAQCAAPFVKLGIYRPGGGAGLSRAAYDDVVIESLGGGG